MRVLGLETSCDETSAAIVEDGAVLAELTWTQDIHETYGGVVPELAARAHLEKLAPTVAAVLERAEIARPDAVAATAGPGLIGAVLVGLSFAKALAMGWSVPFVAVNHLEGHLLSARMHTPSPHFPFLALVVSGGHTCLYDCRGVGDYEVVANTVDDAAGEAFDKVGRMMGLGYPGGPVIDRMAQGGDPSAFPLPRPRPRHAGPHDWSFSGLKTAVRQTIQRDPELSVPDLCASFQHAVVDCLLDRVMAVATERGRTRVVLGGGVAANQGLRQALDATALEVFVPPIRHCTDNAAMIAYAGWVRAVRGQDDGLAAGARAGWPVEELT